MKHSLALRNLIRLIILAGAAAGPTAAALYAPSRLNVVAIVSGTVVLAVLGHWLWRLTDVVASMKADYEPSIAQVRGVGQRLDVLQRRQSELGELIKEVEKIKLVINGERHNLSLVAAAVSEVRSIVDQERSNLSNVADAVGDVRTLIARLDGDARHAVSVVTEFSVTTEATHAHLQLLSNDLAALREVVTNERRNLGLVAGGLDGLRRAVVDAEKVSAHNAAVTDCLLILAQKIDDLGFQPEAGQRTQTSGRFA